MDLLIYCSGSVILVWFGWSLLKMGRKAIKEDERAFGVYDPKFGIVSGPLLILAGIVVFVRSVIMPLFE